MSTVELRLAVSSGDVGAAVRVWREGMECWTPVEDLPELGHPVPGLGQWIEAPATAASPALAGPAAHGASDQVSAARDALPTEPTPTCSPADVPAAVVAAVRVESAPAAAPSEPFELTATPTLAATPDEAPTQAMLAVRVSLSAARAPATRPHTPATQEPRSTPEPSAASLPALGLTVAPRPGVPRARGRFAAAAAALCAIGVVVTAVRGMASGPAAASDPAAIARVAPSLLASTRHAADTASAVPARTVERARTEPRPRDPGQKRIRRASAR